MYMMQMEEPKKEERKYKIDKSLHPRLADFVYFYTEDKASCIVAYLQCDQTALDAGIMLISGMNWVNPDYINLDRISEWTEEKFEDEPSHFIISKKVDYEMMAKIALQGMAPLSKIDGCYNFLNLDEDINVSDDRFYLEFDNIDNEPCRKELRDNTPKKVAEAIFFGINEEPVQKSEEQILAEARQGGIAAAKKCVAQQIDCNIYIKSEYDKARNMEKGFTPGDGPPTK